jgi:hypothetical protein
VLNAVEVDAMRMLRIENTGAGHSIRVPCHLCLLGVMMSVFYPGRLAKVMFCLLRGIIVQNLRGYYTAVFVL